MNLNEEGRLFQTSGPHTESERVHDKREDCQNCFVLYCVLIVVNNDMHTFMTTVSVLYTTQVKN